MNALLAFLLSVGASLLSFTLIMVWYIVPRLSKQPRMQALLPLVLLHTFRTAGLVVLLPQVMGGALPPVFAVPAAYGDLLTTGLAGLSCNGYFDQPFKNKHLEMEKNLHSQLASTGRFVYNQTSSTAYSCSNDDTLT